MKTLLRLVRPGRRQRRANALILVLAATSTLVVAGGTLLVAVTSERTATEQSMLNDQAADASTSGAEDALAKLSVNANYEGAWQVDLGGPVADVTVSSWGDDGIDNDGDGATDESDESDFVAVTSIGRVNELLDGGGNLVDRAARHSRSTTEVILERTKLNLAANQAVYVDDPGALFKFSGDAFLISGNDSNIDGSAGPNAAEPGIGTIGNPTDIINQLSSKQKDNVVGKGGSPSVGSVSDIDLLGTMNSLKSLATITFNGPDDTYSGKLGDFSGRVPVVTYAKGNLSVNGNSSGCGILIVDGDMTFNGTFDYAGIIYVSGAVRFNGGGGGKNVRGALFTLGAVTGNDVTINGSVDIRYSSEAITLVNTQLSSGVTVVAWSRR